jgi:hypothetical protein
MRMFKFGCIALSGLVIGSAASASESAPAQTQNLSQLETIWAKLSDADRAKLLKSAATMAASSDTQKPAPAKKNAKTLSAAASAAIAAKAPPTASPGSPAPKTDTPNSILGGCPGLAFTLRKSWTDIDYGACPQDVGKATGAMLSYSGDQIKHNDAWSAQGTAALVYSPTANGSFATGIYTSVTKLTNSSKTLASSDIDTLGYGAFIQYSVDNSIPDVADWKNYFRLRTGVVNDNIKVTTNANIVAEWMPVYNDGTIMLHTPISIPGTLALFRIDPEIQAQYINVMGKSLTSAFNNRTEALPVGPQVRLALYPGTSDFWSHFVPSLTYWEAYEPYSGRAVSWLDASLTYNLDKDGHLGLTLSYQKGNNVETAGTLTNIYTISLTGKI